MISYKTPWLRVRISMNRGVPHFHHQCLQFWHEVPWILGHGEKVKFLRYRHHPRGGLAKSQPLQPQDRSTKDVALTVQKKTGQYLNLIKTFLKIMKTSTVVSDRKSVIN